MRKVHRGLLYYEMSRAGSNVYVRSHCPPWWYYRTGIVIPAEVWDALPEYVENA